MNMMEFVLTAFCLCNMCVGDFKKTSTGIDPVPFFTAACDISVLPIGTIFKVHGNSVLDGKELMCQTVGGGIKGKRIDIYMGGASEHKAAQRFGVQTLKVEVVHRPGSRPEIKKESGSWRCPMIHQKKRNPLKAGIGIVLSAVAGDIARKKTLP